jgi:ribonucleoside-diphosphate reductase alpha chain
MAASVMDYVARRLALDFLPFEKRAELGVFTADERAAAVRAEAGDDDDDGVDLTAMATAPVSAKPSSPALRQLPQAPTQAPPTVGSSTELVESVIGKAADAPLCLTCGTKMRPAGSCYVCEGCGSTSGCS